MENKCTPKRIKVLITIVDRGKGIKVTELLNEENVMYNIIALATGTARSEILDYLGLGSTEKDLVISIIHEEDVKSVMNLLKEKMQLKEPGNGIAFTIPISSVDSSISLDYICSILKGKKE
ncbi:MAG: hypothetical protein VB128_14110 [Sedimentibacter saalensis]|uniref:hypothetical protein n=1 Tax=Sedimentibacter saalensis TaxID=130788 RepID=UPI002B205CA0|nr:hypothetical protein [Sedimentibacter saalensis]MEA5096082.1 hypothetical protein [Sedimentibacter saalensis]